MVKVTVAMASYNHAAYVGQAIESVLSQKNCDLELCIVDDGSTDQTVSEIKKYKDPRIHLICLKSNEGACVALRKAIQAGTGEYVAVLNSDDAFLPGKLAKQARFLDENAAEAAVFGLVEFIDHKGQILTAQNHFYENIFNQPNRTRFEWLRHLFFKGNCLCHPSVMIRRECYREIGYYDPRLVQLPDFDFWLRLLLRYPIHILQEPLIQFRILPHEANTSAPSEAALRRSQWETTHALQNFLTIVSPEEYFSVFPEDQKLFGSYTQLEKPFIVPFGLACQALNGQFYPQVQAAYRLFGMQTLFPLMNRSEIYAGLSSKSGFNLANFGRKMGEYSVFVNEQPHSIRRLIKELGTALKGKIFNR